MKKSDELKQEIARLEEVLNKELIEFYNKVGKCDVNISAHATFYEGPSSDEYLVAVNAKVDVTISV